MKKPIIYLIIFAVILLTSSCDKKNSVVVIRNESTHFLVGAALDDEQVADSDLYENQVAMNINISPGKFQNIALFDFKMGNKTDSSKLYLYIFYEDSLAKYQKLKMKNGILAKTLVKQVVVQLNTVRTIDTINIR